MVVEVWRGVQAARFAALVVVGAAGQTGGGATSQRSGQEQPPHAGKRTALVLASRVLYCSRGLVVTAQGGPAHGGVRSTGGHRSTSGFAKGPNRCVARGETLELVMGRSLEPNRRGGFL